MTSHANSLDYQNGNSLLIHEFELIAAERSSRTIRPPLVVVVKSFAGHCGHKGDLPSCTRSAQRAEAEGDEHQGADRDSSKPRLPISRTPSPPASCAPPLPWQAAWQRPRPRAVGGGRPPGGRPQGKRGKTLGRPTRPGSASCRQARRDSSSWRYYAGEARDPQSGRGRDRRVR